MTVSTVPYDTISTTSARSEPVFSKCCCCIPLRIGCFILGYLSLAFNTVHTLSLLTVTTYFGIVTHGFDHFDVDSNSDVQIADRPVLNQIGVFLIVVLCANIAWLLINGACLVGLHKKNPGPIRVYVGFATARLLLSLAGFVYLMMASYASTKVIISHSFELGLAAYFILVYYIYANQLERERAAQEVSVVPVSNDISFIYPTKIDKEILVAKY